MSERATTILIIDDEPLLLRMMSLYLGRKGYQVTVAGSAPKARAELAAAAAGFDVIVLDATIAGITPVEFGSEILGGDPNVRVLVASGYPVDMSGLEAAAPGRVAFLHKPFPPEMLAAALRRLLGREEEGL
jgi:DNA-binding NtrC family response regulator